MAKLDLTLSQALQDELEQPGVAAAAVYYDQAGDTAWTDLVINGTLQSSGTYDINLPGTMDGGKVYFLVQSLAGSNDAANPQNIHNVVTAQSNINWSAAYDNDFAYDSFELTLANNVNDVGNLTSVNGYGLPIGVSVPYHSQGGTLISTATVGYGISGTALTNDIAGIDGSKTYTYGFTSGPLGPSGGGASGVFREAVSPTVSVAGGNAGITNPPFNNSDWHQYVTNLEGTQAANIVLSGVFVGTKDAGGIYHNAGYYAYQLRWDQQGGAFWLDPLASSQITSSQIKGEIRITPEALEDSIYSTAGTTDIVDIYSGGSIYLAGMNIGANNQWGAVLVDLITGFSAGYYGTSGASSNDQVSGSIDLDRNINWDPIYAFGNNLAAGSQVPAYFDHYSQIFYDNSNSYGSNYTDALMKQYAVGGPQISLYDTAIGADVSTIDLTLYAPGDTPIGGSIPNIGTSQGYTPPQIYDYIPIPAGQGGYAVPDAINQSNVVKFFFSTQSSTNAGVTLDKGATIDLKILTSDIGEIPQWTTITLDGSTGGSDGLWQNWDITQSGSVYTATATGSSGQAGALLVTGLPTADPGVSGTAVSWYQVVVGDKTFNLYATTGNDNAGDPGKGIFLDPDFAGQQGDLAIDGSATIAPAAPAVGDPIPQYINNLVVNFVTGSGASVDPSLLVQNTDTGTVAQLQTATVPVVGTLSIGGTFEAIQGQTIDTAGTIANVPDSGLVFAWTGENDAAGAPTSTWIQNYTNKIDALDAARISIKPKSGVGQTITATATADVDGQWQTTAPTDLDPGTYVVTMQEYLPGDTGFTTPLTPLSAELTIDVIPCFAAGTRIATITGEMPVEHLAVGDTVMTHGGAVRPIVWIGRRQVDCAHHPKPQSVWPVCVSAHAFGPNLPCRDLWLSPDHAIYLAGALIPVKYLINGTSVCRIPLAEVQYYHIELEQHDIVLADGLPTESYLDTGDRANFANGRTAMWLFPEFAAPRAGQPALIWESRACAPLVVTGQKLATARELLNQRASDLGLTFLKRAGLKLAA